jgi:hypothetical protein
MNSKSAESYVFGYRRGGANDPPIEKAARVIERDAELTRRLDEQVEFDRQIGRAVQAIAPPLGLRQKLGGGDGKVGKGKPFTFALYVAVLCGLSVIVGLLVFFEIDRRERFPGSESVARMVGTAKTMTGIELTPVSHKAGQLGDWFYMRGFEAYAAPRELADATAVGSRIFKLDGNSVAQVVIADHDCVIYTFRAEDFGVVLPEEADWRLRQYENWAAAIRKRAGICTVVTFRGEKSEMRDFLGTLVKK